MTLHDKRLTAQTNREGSAISWRKVLLLNRNALLRAWPIYFPAHDFHSLRLIQPSAKLLPPPGWDEHWSASAREYHEARRRKCAT